MGALRGDFVLTPEAEATYREVRRYYAGRDVRGYLEDHGLAADGYELELIVDRYDRWQGDNEEWYPALGTIVDGVLGDGAGTSREWGDPCDLRVDEDDVRAYLAHLGEG